MARPLWSGTIQISLVGFAVEVYPATSTARPFTFREIDRNTLARVHRQNVSAGPAPREEANADLEEDGEEAAPATTSLHIAPQAAAQIAPRTAVAEAAREVSRAEVTAPAEQHTVERADIVKGYEYEKGKYAVIEPAELKNLRLAGKKTIEVTQFSRASEIDPILYEKAYFVMPKAGPQAAAFAVVRQSLRESGMVGVGEIVFSGRQHLMTLAPPHDAKQPGMMLYTLRFAGELRDAREYSNNLETVEADAAQLGLAKQLIDAYTRPFVIAEFKDHYEEALRELVEAKLNHLPVTQPAAEIRSAKVIDLMDALRRSLAQVKPAESSAGQAAVEQSAAKTPRKPPAKSTGNAKPAAAGSSKRTKSA